MRKRHYICVKVLLPSKKQIWFRLSPKVAKPLAFEMKHNNRWSDYVLNHYINVPVSKYHKNKALITVGKIVDIEKKWKNSRTICTRSQYISLERLGNLKSCYGYMHHDYGFISRLSIALALFYWRKRDYKKSKGNGL